jgi:SAM-dependent methyltransferase
MQLTGSAVRVRLWRLKVRLLPRTRPQPVAALLPPALPPDPSSKAEAALPPDAALPPASELWSELLARYLPPLERLTVLDLGCGRGDLVRYLAEHSAAAILVGVDEQPYWGEDAHALDHGRIRLLAGSLLEVNLPPRSVDVIVSAHYLNRLSPEQVAETLAACAELLRPGGSLVVRVPLCTAAVPTQKHARFSAPFSQLLLGERDLERLLHARFNETLPYINWLTATSYVMLFHQAGLEALDVRRIPDGELSASSEQVERALPGSPETELVGTLEAHLIKPFTLADLRRAGTFVDTRPRSIRDRAETR